jgi:hypothetical protein
MKAFLPLALLVLAAPDFPQDDLVKIHEVKYKYEKDLKAIKGVVEVTVGGVNGELKLIVRTTDEEARDAVRARFGETLEGYKLLILVSRAAAPAATPAAAPPPAPSTDTPGTCVHCPLHCKGGVGQTQAAPRENDDSDASYDQCDVLRKLAGLPRNKSIKVPCQEMIGWTTDTNRIRWARDNGFPMWPSRELPGATCYAWIKHRATCPFGMRQIIKEVVDQTPK